MPFVKIYLLKIIRAFTNSGGKNNALTNCPGQTVSVKMRCNIKKAQFARLLILYVTSYAILNFLCFHFDFIFYAA